jgi:hypothetical protein
MYKKRAIETSNHFVQKIFNLFQRQRRNQMQRCHSSESLTYFQIFCKHHLIFAIL